MPEFAGSSPIASDEPPADGPTAGAARPPSACAGPQEQLAQPAAAEPKAQRQRLSAHAESHRQRVARLFREHNRALVSFLTLRLQSVEEAREVAQEAYVRLLQLDEPDAACFHRAYLYRIASNLALDRFRRRAVRGRYARAEMLAELEPTASAATSPDRAAQAAETLELVQRCLGELSSKCRRAFLLYRLADLTQEEIGSRLGITARMVRHYIAYAMRYFRLRLDGATAPEARRLLKR